MEYESTAAAMNIKDRENNPIAPLGHVAYTRTEELEKFKEDVARFFTAD